MIPLFLSFILFCVSLAAQEIVKNPRKPLSSDAGRILSLEVILTISDESGEFYFKTPRDLKIDQKGNIYISDESQLLKFSSDGTFVTNLVTKGQGPGEVQNYFSYALHGNSIYIYDFSSAKIVHMDCFGLLVDEIRLAEQFNGLYGLCEGRFLFLKSIWPSMKERTGKMLEIEERILQVALDGEVIKISPDFPILAYFGKDFASWWTFISEALDKENNILYLSHSSEYLIEVLDLKENKVVVQLSRKYKRVRHKQDKQKARSPISRKMPERKYENDISQIFFNSGLIWVKTSTKSEKKGTLFDVFDQKGQYSDSFYLKLNGDLMAVKGDSLFVKETDKKENIVIVSYRFY